MQLFTLYSLASPGSVDTQAIVNRELQAARGAIDAWIINFYYLRSLLDVADQTDVDGGLIAYEFMKTSPYSGYVKRCFLLSQQIARGGLVSDATWKYVNGSRAGVLQAYLLAEMAHPDYLRVNGRCVFGFFGPGDITATTNATNNWNSLVGDLGGRSKLYLIGYGDTTHSASGALGFDAYAGYGPLGYLPAGVGQHSSSEQRTKDQSSAGAMGTIELPNGNRQFDVFEFVNIRLDGRPLGATTYSDVPTMPDEIERIQSAIVLAQGYGRSRPSWVGIGEAHDELSEGGTCAPTTKDGDRHYRASRRARGALVGGTETYKIGSSLLYVSASGSWTTFSGSVVADGGGAYATRERESSTSGDTLSLLCDNHILGPAPSGTVGFRCPTGPMFGIADFTLNGISQGTVDLGAAVLTRHVLVKTIAVSAGDTVAFRVFGAHSAGSTNAVRLDAFEPTYAP